MHVPQLTFVVGIYPAQISSRGERYSRPFFKIKHGCCNRCCILSHAGSALVLKMAHITRQTSCHTCLTKANGKWTNMIMEEAVCCEARLCEKKCTSVCLSYLQLSRMMIAYSTILHFFSFCHSDLKALLVPKHTTCRFNMLFVVPSESNTRRTFEILQSGG